jgi:hypothetical protein
LALILFSAESLSLLILMWIATEPIKMYKEIFKTEQANIISCDVS